MSTTVLIGKNRRESQGDKLLKKLKANKYYKKSITAILGLALCHSVFSQAQLSQLHNDLRQTSSSAKKADICYTISIWHSDKLKIDSGLFYANHIKEFSEQTGYRAGMGKYYYAIALALHYRSRNDEAEKNTLKAIEIFASLKETLLIGRSYTQLARIQQALNNNSASRKNYWTAINYLVSGKDHSGLFRNYFWLGRIYKRTSEIDSAAFYYVKALEMAELLGDDKRIQETACEGWGNLFAPGRF